MNYGIPYMGSKSGIVKLIQYILDRHYKAEYFIDVFTGGFAVSHYVLLNSNKKVLANDYNKYVVALLHKLIYEGLPDEVYNFVDRELFIDVRDNPDKYEDWYVGYVTTIWSFGNSQRQYMYGKEIEPYKKIMHEAIVNNVWHDDIKFLKNKVPKHIKKLDYRVNKGKRVEFLYRTRNQLKFFNDKLQDLNQLERAQQLERLERAQQLEQLERLERAQQLEQLERLERAQQLEQLERMDWKQFIQSIPQHILTNSVVYCDPPYEDTATYAVGGGLDYNSFWEWFRTAPYAIYVSSYKAPDDIEPLNFEFKNQLLSGGVGKKVEENLYWNGKGDYEPTLEDLLFNE